MPAQLFGLQLSQTHTQTWLLAAQSLPLRSLQGLSINLALAVVVVLVVVEAALGRFKHLPVLVASSHSHLHWLTSSLQSLPLMPAQLVGLQLRVLESHVQGACIEISMHSLRSRSLQEFERPDSSYVGAPAASFGAFRHSPVFVSLSHFQVHRPSNALQSVPLMPVQVRGLQFPVELSLSQSHAQTSLLLLQSLPLRPLQGLSLNSACALFWHSPVLAALSHFQRHWPLSSLQSLPYRLVQVFGLHTASSRSQTQMSALSRLHTASSAFLQVLWTSASCASPAMPRRLPLGRSSVAMLMRWSPSSIARRAWGHSGESTSAMHASCCR
mmetsp:Transcript_64333/g.149680  ORF Transcript_64333/g.149680 Transcript_64333/m.149680 type:complete len:327 (+) Transcript_64333:466-1446(+)